MESDRRDDAFLGRDHHGTIPGERGRTDPQV